MKLSIDLIKSSSNPVRTQWDEGKMNELVQSIKEQGLIVPIKVRPIIDSTWLEPISEVEDQISELLSDEFLGDKFEIVYGHRRAEACKRAGLTEIEVTVERIDDIRHLLQQIIENESRENVPHKEKAQGYARALEGTGWSIRKLAQACGIPRANISELLQWLKLEEKGITAQTIHREGDTGLKTVLEVDRALKEDDQAKKEVLSKVENEGLGYRQARQLAESIKEAPTKQAKKKLLEWEFNSEIHNPERIKERTKQFGEHDPLYLDEKPSPQDNWEKVPEIKIMVDGLVETIKSFTKLLGVINKATKIEGRLSFEAKQFTATKLRKFRDEINTLLDQLEVN